MTNSISIYRGDTRTITVTITNADGTAFNLTGYTVVMTVKRYKEDADVDAVLTKTAVVAAPATGIAEFNLLPAETDLEAKDYFYDVQVNNGASIVYTVLDDVLTITMDVTRTTS